MRQELREALEEGFGLIAVGEHRQLRHRIAWAVNHGTLVRVLPGIFAVAGCVDFRLRCRALMLADPDAVIVGHAAAHLHGWEGAREPNEIRAISKRRRYLGDIVTLAKTLPPELVSTIEGIRVTCPVVTALDLVADQGGDAIDNALRRGATLADLWEAFSAMPCRRGNAAIKAMLIDSRDQPWSEAERIVHRLLREAGITGWRTNYAVQVADGRVFIDIAFPHLRLAIEIDGYEFHGGRGPFERDRLRDVALSRKSWEVHRFPATYVMDRPDAFVSDVHALIQVRARALGLGLNA